MRTIILIIALVLNALATPFILKVKTNNAGTSTSTQFALTPINNGYSYNYHVDWGDDSDNDYTNATAHTHTYAEAGTYSISITENVAGGFAGMQVLGDSLKAVEIVQWGTNAWYEFSHSFSGARNLILSATDTATANFTNVQSFDGAFSTCCLFTGFSYIATPAATTYYSMFSGDTLLVSCGLRGSLTLTNVGRMLKNCKKLKSYASIETRNVTSFIYMFENAAVLDSVKWMRTGNGTDFSGMCLGCGIVSFPVLDISKGRYFISTWAFDSLMVTFPGLNFAAALDLSYTWRCCYLLDSLPDIVTPVLTNCHETIVECRKLRHAPMMNTGLVTNIEWFATDDTTLTSTPNYDFSSVVLGQYAFSNCHALVTFTPSSFPLATDLTGMWYNDSKIVLPVLNLPKASNLTTTFYNVTLTHTAYSGLLQNLAINNSEINLALDVGTSKSDYWSRSYKGTLVARGWTITDGGRYGPTPTAVIGYVPLTINHTKVLETNIHFPWLYDLSKITDTMFWFRVTEPGDIVIMDSAGVVLNDSTIVDTLNKTAKTGTILWDASISTATDKTYRLCICPGYAHQNNKKALTNSHIIARYGMDGGTSPLADGCENYPLTNHTGTLGQTGKIGKSVTLGNTKYLQSGIMTERANATKWGLSMIVKYVDAPDNQWLIIDPGVEEITIKKYYEYLQLYMGSAIFGYSAGLTTYGVNAGDWFYVCVDYDGTQTGNPNRMRVTINGSNATLHGYEGTIPSALAASPNMFRYGYDDATGWHGSIDEVRHSTDAKSTLYRTTEYNSIFDATSVTKGTWLSYDTTKLAQDDPSVDTIRIDTIALTHAYTYTKPMKCLYFHVTSMDSIIFSSRVFCRDSVVYSSNCKITRLFTKGIYTMPGYTLLRRLNGNTHTPHIYNRSKVKWL